VFVSLVPNIVWYSLHGTDNFDVPWTNRIELQMHENSSELSRGTWILEKGQTWSAYGLNSRTVGGWSMNPEEDAGGGVAEARGALNNVG
jgi:hypothetical protein